VADWVLCQDKHIDIIILYIYIMGLFGEKKTWANYFGNLGKTISKGASDTYNSTTKLAADSANGAKQSIKANTGYNVGGRRRKTRRKMTRRNHKSRRNK
jgi:hypothetical protein